MLDPDVAPAWALGHGATGSTLAELAADPVVRAEVAREVDVANERFSHAEAVREFTVLPHEWLPDSEELTPTMKLKRRGIAAKYANRDRGLLPRVAQAPWSATAMWSRACPASRACSSA